MQRVALLWEHIDWSVTRWQVPGVVLGSVLGAYAFTQVEAEGLQVFIAIAFWGLFPPSLIVTLIVSNYVFKCGVEILFTPVTYWLTSWLKHQENEDFYDRSTNFNPFYLFSDPVTK